MSNEKMREAFEHWFSSNDCDPLAICRNDDGSYMLTPAQISWASWQAALSQPADRDVMRQAVTDGMIAAYWSANDRYWRETRKWRDGTVSEATRVGLEAALAAAPPPPAEQREQYPVAQVLPGNGFLAEVPNGLPPGTKLYTRPAPDVLATLRAKVEALHNVSHYDIWFKNQVLALIDKMGGKV